MARLTLQRDDGPNRLDVATVEALGSHLSRLEDERDVAVIIITARGDTFCGAEAEPADAMPAAARTRCLRRGDLMLSLQQSSKATLAVVNGEIVSHGIEFLLVCDFVVADTRARLSCRPAAESGWDHGAQLALSRMLPRRIALSMLMTGRSLSAAEADRLGLFNALVPTAELAATADQFAASLAAPGAVLVTRGKNSFDQQSRLDLARAYARAADQVSLDLRQPDEALPRPETPR